MCVSIPLEQVEAFASSNGVVAHLEAKAASETNGTNDEDGGGEGTGEGEEEEGDGDEEEEDSEDVRLQCARAVKPLTYIVQDVEIIMEPPSRSLDFRYVHVSCCTLKHAELRTTDNEHKQGGHHSRFPHPHDVRLWT